MKPKQLTIVVGLIKNNRGEILLIKRREPKTPQIHEKWEFPGGGIEFGEAPEAAVIREIKEETGLKVKIIRLLPKIYDNLSFWAGQKVHVLLLAYECKIIGGSLGSEEPEVGKIKYFKTKNVPYSQALPKTKEIVKLLTSN